MCQGATEHGSLVRPLCMSAAESFEFLLPWPLLLRGALTLCLPSEGLAIVTSPCHDLRERLVDKRHDGSLVVQQLALKEHASQADGTCQKQENDSGSRPNIAEQLPA
eukprot:CAMPEP_0178369922 /NCGR_PEP_ID=MMETSP0689_2-20121128/26_1 /TAXON_ID=160604 /ORGANISM="Amphidinium massartii, Strain CS-259" /LENGTH=106 /DNA_ID=CAMNT_0019989707 /DNA_START=411 /DNA_END=728 /DNA_ORIENTATION=-